ncbi:YybH family protein [Gemmatimonas sp.]|jgi:ketosteroid isomerase-like protein|uniref:YybH family protein n=1 Tax=Gemmatimonas sp. TaxID=1962908 RepID=UPI0037BE8934
MMSLRSLGALARGLATAAFALTAVATPRPAQAQWTTTYEQFYLQAPHNWTFRNQYASADRLFNAFDYGHAILYETLWTKPNASASRLEVKEFDFLTRTVLVKPPRVPLEEAAIEPKYAQLAPEAKVMFDWAHILHRQLYDVLADERLSDAQRDTEAQRLLAYYRSRPDIAFSAKPRTMALMQEQSFSLAFRKKYPKFNGLIWGYHWLQVGLYEPLLVGKTVAAKQAGVRATVARFWQMVDGAPTSLPYQMPMTAAVAPAFAARFPEAAIIFDNLHSMHDVVSDILTNDAVPRDRKRTEILRAARLYRDDTSYVMPVAAWLAMSGHMGIENMGGPAVGFLPSLPLPTVTSGAVMTHDWETGAMKGFTYGAATGGAHAEGAHAESAHAGHDMAAMAMPATVTVSAANDSAEVAALVRRFHTALAQADSLTVIGLLTDDAEILESGAVESVADYRSHHLPADIALATAIASTRTPLRVAVQGDLATSTSTSVTKGTFRDRAVDSTGAELIVARRTAQGWRISAIHWSARQRN